MGLDIRINKETCIGSGNCVFWQPTVFDQEEEGTAFVKDAGGAPDGKIVEAARNCPTTSISVFRGSDRLV